MAKILLAENREDVQHELELLVSLGYEVELACVLEDVRAKWLEGGFDLIIVETQLPFRQNNPGGRNLGLELLEEMMAKQDNPPVILTTSWVQSDYNYGRLGFARIFFKPYHLSDLIEAVEEVFSLELGIDA